MDGARFDTLARSLTTPGTRRGALGGLLLSALSVLGLSDAQHATAKDCKKIKDKKKRKKCLNKAQQDDNTPPCVPTCAAANACGSNGCGG